MRHPTEGVLRRLLDEPAGVPDADRRHVAGCARCRAASDAVRADAHRVAAALAVPPGAGTDLDAAWQRLSAATPPRTASRRRRSSGLLRRPAAAAVAVAVVLTGAGTAAANGWLPVFRTERVSPVSITPGDLVALPDLSGFGELAVGEEPELREVPDAAAAEEATGLDVPQVAELPRGVVGAPTYQVGDRVTAIFTFSAERAARAAAEAGADLPPVPPGLDGSRIRLEAGPGVAQVWQSASGAPALLVGRAVAPAAYSTGVPFETARDYLLSLPGLPADVAAQLRTFTDGGTLPLPVPADEVSTSPVEVDGAPATLLEARNGALAGVVWVRAGLLTVVLGSLDDDEVLDVARGLR